MVAARIPGGTLNHGKYTRITAFLRRGHDGKIQHDALATAEHHADRLNNFRERDASFNPWRPYECPLCSKWHVSRSPLRPRVTERAAYDVTMVDAIGERAFHCGQLESTGHPASRKAAILQRAKSAKRRSWLGRQHTAEKRPDRFLP